MVPKDWEREVDNSVAHIAGELAHRRIGFLFGAGMSIQSGGISGRQVAFELILRSLYKHEADKEEVDQAVKQNIDAVASKYPLEAIASGIQSEFPFQGTELNSILKEVVFRGEAPELHAGHTDLASIMALLNTPRLLFTTNWDTLIEDALEDRAVTITHNNFRSIFKDDVLSNRIGVVHLHGTFEDDPLIEETDLMSTDRPLFSLFVAELMTKSFVFVGYSLSDPNMRALYFAVNEILMKQRVHLGKITYVVFPARNDVDRTVSAATWGARKAKYIPLPANEFFKRLHEQLEMKGIKELKEELRKRLSLTQQELDDKVNEIKSVFPDLGTNEQVLVYLDTITRGGIE